MNDQPITHQTRAEAYQSVLPMAETREEEVLEVFRGHVHGLTGEECAAILGRHPYVVRPRITSLKAKGKLKAVGKRKSADGTRNVAVFRLAEVKA